MTIEERNMELFQKADDAWNAQDLETFSARHAKEVVVNAPGQTPQRGLDAHTEFALRSFKAFPDQRVENRPYKVFFASGDWVLSIARYTGTMTGPLVLQDGTEIPPTGKSFDVDFATVGHWEDGQMIEEYLFYDIATFNQQVGLAE